MGPTQCLGTKTALQRKRQSSKTHKAAAFEVTWNRLGEATASGFQLEKWPHSLGKLVGVFLKITQELLILAWTSSSLEDHIQV